MATRLPTATQNAMAAAAAALVDAGPSFGKIEVRTGAQPATGNDTATGTLLVTFTLQDPALTGPINGVMTLAGVPISATPVASGTAGWFRYLDSTGAKVCDGICGVSGAQLNLTTTALTSGVAIAIASGTMTMPAL